VSAERQRPKLGLFLGRRRTASLRQDLLETTQITNTGFPPSSPGDAEAVLEALPLICKWRDKSADEGKQTVCCSALLQWLCSGVCGLISVDLPGWLAVAGVSAAHFLGRLAENRTQFGVLP